MNRTCALASLLFVAATATVQRSSTADPGSTLPDVPPCTACSIENTEADGPFACPLFPIMTLTSGTVYYCDFYDPDCEAEPTPAYAVGAFDYPTFCPDCIAVPARAQQTEFTGMARPVQLQTAKVRFISGMDASRELFGETYAITNPTQGNYRTKTAGMVRLTADGKEHIAVVLQVEFLRRSGGRAERFVACEVDRRHAEDEQDVAEAISPSPLPGGRAYQARFTAESGDEVPILILLARST